MTSKEIILNDIIEHLDLLINNEPIGMELSKYIECLKDDILFLFKSLKKEKPTLTDDEKAILRNIDKNYKWIARDKNTMLFVFTGKPIKKDYYWECEDKDKGYFVDFYIFDNLFQFIKWEDDEPYLIEDLLKEQEDDE